MELYSTIANIVMAVGALLILWQIREARNSAVTSFEDSMDKEYRDIIHCLPAKVMLGAESNDTIFFEHLDEFYSYIDLCNQQTFLRQRKRVRRSTWLFWSDGMRSNLDRPAFRAAWEIIKKEAPGDFSELRKLEESNFEADPAKW
jgi:hypothetical protein